MLALLFVAACVPNEISSLQKKLNLEEREKIENWLYYIIITHCFILEEFVIGRVIMHDDGD